MIRVSRMRFMILFLHLFSAAVTSSRITTNEKQLKNSYLVNTNESIGKSSIRTVGEEGGQRSIHSGTQDSSSSKQQRKEQHDNNMKQRKRALQSQTRLFTYEPETPVLTYAAIDLDQKEIKEELIHHIEIARGDGTIESELQPESRAVFRNALTVYSQGAHSRSYAHIELNEPLTYSTPKGSPVVGYSLHGKKIEGAKLLNDVQMGDTVVEILYPALDDAVEGNNNGLNFLCAVGGSANGQFDGCFSGWGNITIGQNPAKRYTYDLRDDNRNLLSMQLIAMKGSCNTLENSCEHRTRKRFVDYYGTNSYAHEWVMSAFGSEELFDHLSPYDSPGTMGGRHANFALYKDIGRAEAVSKGTVTMGIWMYVIDQLEAAVDTCVPCSGPTCQNNTVNIDTSSSSNFFGALGTVNENLLEDAVYNALHEWDIGVAIYTGSTHEESFVENLVVSTDPDTFDGFDDDEFDDEFGEVDIDTSSANSGMFTSQQSGYLLLGLADRMCMAFSTCGVYGNQAMNGVAAKVNYDIFDQFIFGKHFILNGQCNGAKESKERITKLMAIPLIQGTLQHAYMIGEQNDFSEKTEAAGATFAASILPLIHYCSPADAEIIYQNMRVRGRYADEEADALNGATDFLHVKAALERNYNCLAVTCTDIGGLIDTESEILMVSGAGIGIGSGSSTPSYLPKAEPCTFADIPSGHDVPRPSSDEVTPPDYGPAKSGSTTSSTESTGSTSNNNRPQNNRDKLNRSPVDVSAVGIGVCIMIAALAITILCSLCWKDPNVNGISYDVEEV